MKTAKPCKTQTPWGKADFSDKIASGIIQYSTPSHGGYLLSPKRIKQMNPALTKCGFLYNKNMAFEEDCAWCAVHLSFPELFQSTQESAKETLKHNYWEIYEQYYNVVLQKGESHDKDDYFFYEENKNNYIAISASMIDQEYTKVIMKLGGRKNENGEEVVITVLRKDYNNSKFALTKEQIKNYK